MRRRDRHFATGMIAAALPLTLLVAAGIRAAADDPKDKAGARYMVNGQVLDPDGRPMAGRGCISVRSPMAVPSNSTGRPPAPTADSPSRSRARSCIRCRTGSMPGGGSR